MSKAILLTENKEVRDSETLELIGNWFKEGDVTYLIKSINKNDRVQPLYVLNNTNMNREEKYDAVAECETLEELSKVILSLADTDGMIQGKTRKFNAKKMAHACMAIGIITPNALTRAFGIRQQALYILNNTV